MCVQLAYVGHAVEVPVARAVHMTPVTVGRAPAVLKLPVLSHHTRPVRLRVAPFGEPASYAHAAFSYRLLRQDGRPLPRDDGGDGDDAWFTLPPLGAATLALHFTPRQPGMCVAPLRFSLFDAVSCVARTPRRRSPPRR